MSKGINFKKLRNDAGLTLAHLAELSKGLFPFQAAKMLPCRQGRVLYCVLRVSRRSQIVILESVFENSFLPDVRLTLWEFWSK